MCKVSSVFLMVGLFILLIFQTAFTTQPTIPSKKIDMNITFSSEPDTGKECIVTFSFTPLEEIEHQNELNDEASIYFYPEDGIEIISGVPKWEGRLNKGKTEIIQIVFKVTKPGSFQFDGVVKSCRVNPQFIRRNPKVSEKIAKKAYEKIFLYRNVVSKRFQIGELEETAEMWSIDASTGEAMKIKVKVKDELLGVPPSIAPGEAAIRETGSSQNELSNTGQTQSKSTIKEYAFQVNRDREWVEEERAYLIGTVKLRKGESAVIFLFNQNEQDVIQTNFELSGDYCTLRRLPGNKLELTAVKDRGDCKIIGFCGGVKYLIKVLIEDISFKKTSSGSDLYYTINGTFRYVDNDNDTLPMLNTEVVCYYWDEWGQQWVWEDSTHTNANGYFTVTTTHSKVKVSAWSTNPDCVVFRQDGYLHAGPMYLYGWSVIISNLSGNLTIPLSYTTVTNPDWAGAFGILPVISKGRKFIENVVGWFYRPPQNAVYWDNTSYQDSVTGFAPGLQWNGVGIIVIKGRLIRDDRDQWDPDVILHEYGHLCMQVYAQFPPKSSGPHYYYRLPALPPGDTSVIFPNLAWSEGWAYFLACAIDSTTPEEIWNLDNNNEVRSILDLETPLPDVPYYNTYWDQTGPSSTIPFYNGYDIEGAIAEALWDIYDVTNDGNFYIGYQIWGHNNDYNQNDYWRGINAIWDVFENYDPSPSDPNHNHCFTFYEFKKGWKEKWYPFEGHFSDILCAHNIEPTANNVPNIAGDANSDGNVSISDVVYLINYLFKFGPAPEPSWRGDANGDCKVTLSDIVYIINYALKGGPLPHLWSDCPERTCCNYP